MIAWVLGALLLAACLDAFMHRAMAKAFERELERVRYRLACADDLLRSVNEENAALREALSKDLRAALDRLAR